MLFPVVDQDGAVIETPSGEFVAETFTIEAEGFRAVLPNLAMKGWYESRSDNEYFPVVIRDSKPLVSEWKFIVEDIYESEMATAILDARYLAEREETKREQEAVNLSVKQSLLAAWMEGNNNE
jgi:hypothetical protein